MTYRLPTGPESRLMAGMFSALEQGDICAVLETPASDQKQHTLGYVLAATVEQTNAGEHLFACLVRALMYGLKSADTTTRVQVMAEAANIARLYADAQAPKPIAAPAPDLEDDDSPADPDEAFARAAAFAHAAFPVVRS